MQILAIFLLLTGIVTASPSTLPQPEQNLTAIIGPTCLDSSLWSLPTFSASDCQQALRKLLDGDVARYGREVFDFMVAGATSRTRYRKVQLPASYEYGTCTLAIAMLATLPVKYIPPIPLGTFFPETDRTTYETLSILAQRVEQQCVDGGVGSGRSTSRRRRSDPEDYVLTLPGWSTAGSRNAIGVFFVDSRSYMRRLLFGGLGGGGLRGHGSMLGAGVLNQTVALGGMPQKSERML